MSNDERCVHAVDGPDWAGLRELYPEKPDYKALVKEAREYVDALAGGESANWVHLVQHADFLADAVESLLAIEQRLTDHIVQLAAERDALQAENAQLRGDLSESRRALDDAINVANGNKIARDALQARLDAMRVEERWQRIALNARGRIIPGRLVKEQRLVGPWTVVPEGEQQ